MIINISLHEDGPPMWFLGEPKTPKIALNFMEPGPIIVEFDSFNDSEKTQIIRAIELNRITSSIEVLELKKSMVIPEVKAVENSEPKEFIPIKETQKEKPKSPIDAFLKQRNEEMTSISNEVLNLKAQQIKTKIKEIKDIKLLRKMRTIELDGHNRKTIIGAISKQISDLSKIAKDSIQDTGLQDLSKDDKINEDLKIEEVEEKEIHLTIDNEGNIITV